MADADHAHLKGALAGDDGLDEEAKHGEHGEAAVLDLLDLELGEGVGVIGQAQGVEALAGVEAVEAEVLADAAVEAVALNQAHEDDGGGDGGADGLGVDEAGVACREGRGGGR